MSIPILLSAARSRWMDWKPSGHLLVDLPGCEPSKPSKPGLVAHDGAVPTKCPLNQVEPGLLELACASDLLSCSGARIMQIDGAAVIGIWSDLDGPDLREAIRLFALEQPLIRYLDGDDVPMPYKVRRVEGEPVPLNVLAEMERHPDQPWVIRDQMLGEMGWCSKPSGSRRHQIGLRPRGPLETRPAPTGHLRRGAEQP